MTISNLVAAAWIPLTLAIFSFLPPRRAIISTITAWLFLPNLSFPLAGLPPVTKATLTMGSVMIGALVFDSVRVRNLRPRWYDAAICVWCVCPFFTSLLNGLGLYDGLSGVFSAVLSWGLPYIVGRIYFADPAGVHELAMGIVMGALAYVPFCLYEIRMSPTLHQLFYGFHPRARLNTLLQKPGLVADAWRPFVFFEHGLALCIFMVTASILGVWMWRCGTVKQLHGIPIAYLLMLLVITAVLCQGTASIGLLVVGLGALFLTKWSKMRVAVILLWMVAPTYYALRIPDILQAETVAAVVERVIPSKAGSLHLRMWQETRLMSRVLERPVFGWGAWGRGRRVSERETPPDDDNHFEAFIGADGKIAGIDALWLNVLSANGLVGLFAYTAVLLLPAAMIIRGVPAPLWGEAAFAPATGCAVMLIVVVIENLLNGIPSPIPVIVAGGLTELAGSKNLAGCYSKEALALDGEGDVLNGLGPGGLAKGQLWPR